MLLSSSLNSVGITSFVPSAVLNYIPLVLIHIRLHSSILNIRKELKEADLLSQQLIL